MTVVFVGSVVVVGGCAVLGLWAVWTYNGLVGLRNRLRNAFSQIDVQLKRRHDLVPNLVEATRAYLAHERQTLEAVIAARSQAVTASERAAASPGEASAMRELARAEGALSGVLGRLLAVSEAYPDLKANETVGRLTEELASTENRVAFSRQAYNDAVMTYNTSRERFPAVLIAGSLGFREASPFEIEEPAERAAPRIAL